MSLSAPFPWHGGKSRWADLINERIGTVGVYVEPCAGSFACGLRRAPSPHEIMCDTDHLLINAYRGIRGDFEQTAYHASYPTFHADLTARQPWLIRWRAEHGWRVTEDPDWFDPKAAGWWIWGVSNWIGGGWCAEPVHDRRPARCDDKRVYANDRGGGRGVQAQRDKVPKIGIHTGGILDGTRWQPWFRSLAKRLERVVILNRPWQSAVTSSMLQHTPSGPKPTVGILMDPPYLTRNARGKRDDAIYYGDQDADTVARETYEWAVEHGARYRIAYCCHRGDFPVPKGWTEESRKFAGVWRVDRREKRVDQIMFSPACVREQKELF